MGELINCQMGKAGARGAQCTCMCTGQQPVLGQGFAKPCQNFAKRCQDFAKPCQDFAKPCQDFAEPCKDFVTP